jgi:hypothetical protein
MPKISELNALTSVSPTDLIVVAHDVAGLPSTNKITVSDFANSLRTDVLPSGESPGYILSGITIIPAATRYPSTARGRSGDKAGMLAIAGAYIYYCYADYVNGSTPIWQKTSMDNTDWD